MATRTRRRRSRTITVRVARGGSLPAGVSYGRAPRDLGSSLATHENRMRRRPEGPLPSGRFPARGTAGTSDGVEDSDDNEHELAYFQGAQPAPQHRKRTTEENNRRLHEQWTASLRDNIFMNTCFKAGAAERMASLQQQLKTEYYKTAEQSLGSCQACAFAELGHNTFWELVDGAADILFVSILGRAQVSHPSFRCSGQCGTVVRLSPVSFGCFPATPTQPQVYYSEALLALTHSVRLSGPLPMEAWCAALEEIHIRNGCAAHVDIVSASLPKRVWRNLGSAVRQWWRMETATLDINQYSVQPISCAAAAVEDLQLSEGEAEDIPEAGQPALAAGESASRSTAVNTCGSEIKGPGHQCPACYKTCVAAMADACVGLTQLKAAGRATDFLEPQRNHSPFMGDPGVKDLLLERKRLDPAALERPLCAEFAAAAATLSGRQSRLNIQVRFRSPLPILERNVAVCLHSHHHMLLPLWSVAAVEDVQLVFNGSTVRVNLRTFQRRASLSHAHVAIAKQWLCGNLTFPRLSGRGWRPPFAATNLSSSLPTSSRQRISSTTSSSCYGY